MKKINLWSIHEGAGGAVSAKPIDTVKTSETEKQLEDLFVSSPNLLADGLRMVGRQVQTAGGPLDLLGIDADGHVVIFELKKGVLTRDAVAQVVDYASDLADLGFDGLARWVEAFSGRSGVEKIDDFRDWYGQEFPSRDDPLDGPPKMVLVGLGVDDRARRMVDFLAESGIDIQLLTFHAFRVDGQLLLAKQVESVPAKTPGGGGSGTNSKEANLEAMKEQAKSLGIQNLIQEVASFIDQKMPAAYRWPGKTGYSFSLSEKTKEGKPTMRSYLGVFVVPKQHGSVNVQLNPRARRVAATAVDVFCETVPSAHRTHKSYSSVDTMLTKKTWEEAKAPLDALIQEIVRGWEEKKWEGGEGSQAE